MSISRTMNIVCIRDVLRVLSSRRTNFNQNPPMCKVCILSISKIHITVTASLNHSADPNESSYTLLQVNDLRYIIAIQGESMSFISKTTEFKESVILSASQKSVHSASDNISSNNNDYSHNVNIV